eukprot:m.31083 g.31083  ORF g.31083 m.31083 type:complete len:721 (+) comp5304_c0_seq1:82-2244(+)
MSEAPLQMAEEPQWRCYACYRYHQLLDVSVIPTCRACGQPAATWEREMAGGDTWERYAVSDVAALERAFNMGHPTCRTLSDNLTVDLCTLEEIHPSGIKRRVRRQQGPSCFALQPWLEKEYLSLVRDVPLEQLTLDELYAIVRASDNPVVLPNGKRSVSKAEAVKALFPRLKDNPVFLSFASNYLDFPIHVGGVEFKTELELALHVQKTSPWLQTANVAVMLSKDVDKEQKLASQALLYKNCGGSVSNLDCIPYLTDKEERRMACISALIAHEAQAMELADLCTAHRGGMLWLRDLRVPGLASGSRASATTLASRILRAKAHLYMELAAVLPDDVEPVRIGKEVWTRSRLRSAVDSMDKKTINDRIFLVRGVDNGRDAWYYILVLRSLLDFQVELGSPVIHLENHGKILDSAYGKDPSDAVENRIKAEYCLDQDDDILSAIDHLHGILRGMPCLPPIGLETLREALLEFVEIDTSLLSGFCSGLEAPTKAQVEYALEQAHNFALTADVPGWPIGNVQPFLAWKMAIHLYTMEDPCPIYRLLNASFNARKKGRSTLYRIRRFLPILLSALDALPESLQHSGTLYRGVDCQKSIYFQNLLVHRQALLAPGSTLNFAGFTSASPSKEVALCFARGLVFVLEGVRGYQIGALSRFKENEILISPPLSCYIETAEFDPSMQSTPNECRPELPSSMRPSLLGTAERSQGCFTVHLRPSRKVLSLHG